MNPLCFVIAANKTLSKMAAEKVKCDFHHLSSIQGGFCHSIFNFLQIIAKDLPEVISTMRDMGEKVKII